MTKDTAVATRDFHNETKQYEGAEDFSPRAYPVGFTSMAADNQPTAFKRYPDASRVPLTHAVGQSDVPAEAVLSGDAVGGNPMLDEQLLARVLFYASGVTRVRSKDGEVLHWFRAAPAAGNLHPVETYVVCADLGGVPAGVHHFEPGEFALETLRSGDRRGALAAALADDGVAASPVSLVFTGVPWRTGWKYAARGLRHVYWDAGSLLAQALAVAEAAGVPARVHLAFVDAEISEELGVDGETEFPVAVVTLGGSTSPAAEPAAAPLVGGEPEQTSSNPMEFDLVTRAQKAGDLADVAEVERWRKTAAGLGQRTSVLVAAPKTAVEPPAIEELIRRRGSTRMFRHESVPEDVARWCLAVASRPVSGDFCAGGASLLSHFVSVHEVDGLSPGLYRWSDGDLSLIAGEDAVAARAGAQRLCVGQALGGDSAFTTFHCADLDEVLAGLGDRGYRAAQLEAGLVAGRLQLAAFASGLGGTGLTFLDDEVSKSFAVTDACMLVTAVGPSDYRSREGGLPGRPTELSGFAPSVVERYKARATKT